MNGYLLTDYRLSNLELFQSLFISEYGLRHLDQAKIQPQYKWGHRIIAVVELCPLIGLIATIAEAIIARYVYAFSSPSHSLTPKRTWLFIGSQEGCEGSVSVAKVEAVRAKLESQSEFGITFNKNKITGRIEGGTCTAMSLKFADAYFKLKQAYINSENPQTEVFLDKISKIGREFLRSSESMRVLQAAYNSIEVKKEYGVLDYSINKIKSLANYYDFKIGYSSREIEVDRVKADKELQDEVEYLPEGIYMVRILKSSDNEKLEEHGHSVVYVKEQGIGLFYDPNYGARNLFAGQHSQILFKAFREYFSDFQVNKARFYQLQPNCLP